MPERWALGFECCRHRTPLSWSIIVGAHTHIHVLLSGAAGGLHVPMFVLATITALLPWLPGVAYQVVYLVK